MKTWGGQELGKLEGLSEDCVCGVVGRAAVSRACNESFLEPAVSQPGECQEKVALFPERDTEARKGVREGELQTLRSVSSCAWGSSRLLGTVSWRRGSCQKGLRISPSNSPRDPCTSPPRLSFLWVGRLRAVPC